MYKPTVKQLAAIEALVAHPEMTQREIAESVGISEVQLCKLRRKNAGFKALLDERLRETWADSRRVAQKTMIKLAEEGDFQASKYILDSAGYAAPQEINLNANVIKVTVEDD